MDRAVDLPSELGDELRNCVANLNEIDSLSDPKKEEYQTLLAKTIKNLENLTRQVSLLGLFSKNEDVEEISTTDIQFLLLPALLGYLTEKVTNRERKDILDAVEVYFKDYLTRLKSYSVISTNLWWIDEDKIDEVKPTGSSLGSLNQPNPNALREDKIKQYKVQQELKAKQEDLQKLVDTGSADDETLRLFYITELNLWASTAETMLLNVEQEKPLAERMALIKSGQLTESPSVVPKQVPLKPVIITRTEMQKKVYGLGYPSVPTVSLEEFFEEKRREGQIQVVEGSKDKGPQQTDEDEKVAKELASEKDNKDHIDAQRDWDDYRDDHRRGWGSVHNKG